MKKKVIIFGLRDYAELAHFYLENDSDYQVTAFSVTENYLPENQEFRGLPIVAFEKVEEEFPPTEFSFFAPMSPRKMNQARETIYKKIKQKGYDLISYISSKAIRFNGKIGENCFILEGNIIQPFTTVGNNVVLWSGNFIGHHGQIKDHVTLSCQVVMAGHCVIGENCFLGINSSLRNGVTLAKGTLVGMSAAIIKDTEEWGVYLGNPAKKKKDVMSYNVY